MKIKRQGDVLFIKRENLPTGDSKPIARDNGRVVVAYGEVTGHSHATVASTWRKADGSLVFADWRDYVPVEQS